MFIKVEPNPDGGPDNAEARWWKDWITKKNKKQELDNEKIKKLRQKQINLEIQKQQTTEELTALCKRYDELVKQLAAEERSQSKIEHRRLEIE